MKIELVHYRIPYPIWFKKWKKRNKWTPTKETFKNAEKCKTIEQVMIESHMWPSGCSKIYCDEMSQMSSIVAPREEFKFD